MLQIVLFILALPFILAAIAILALGLLAVLQALDPGWWLQKRAVSRRARHREQALSALTHDGA